MADKSGQSGGGSKAGDEFARQADQQAPGLMREFLDFLLHNKKWWLIPILVVLAMVAVLVILGGTAIGPWIYTIF